MDRVVTKGSVWLLDDGRYCRMPLTEEPRRAEWSQGVLKDLWWHPCVSWEIRTEEFDTPDGLHAFPDYLPALVINLPDGNAIYAPNATREG